MATYDGSHAYNFELFEPKRAIPTPKKEEPKGPQKLVKPKQKTQAQIRAEIQESNRRIAAILAMASTLMLLLGINMYSRARLTQLAKETSAIQASISEQDARMVDLQSKLTQKMSMSSIEDYASNKLGMIKGNRSQINYITVNGSDSVVYKEGNNGSRQGE